MTIGRREFFGQGFCAALAAVFSFEGRGWRAFATTPQRKPAPQDLPISENAFETLASLTRASFEAQCNTSFTVQGSNRLRAELRLARVVDRAIPGLPPFKETENFSVIFTGPISPVLLQGTYLFYHPELGEFPLFLVPGHSRKEPEYEAIINRLRR